MSKQILEARKLRLEIRELNKHWAKKPQYLQVLLPTTLAIFSLLYAITSGLFSSKQELLELNKKRLETDILAFQKTKDTLVANSQNLRILITKYNDSLQDKNLILKKYENSFTKEKQKIQSLNDEILILKTTKEDYNNKISLLEKEYSTKKQTYLKEIESKYYKEIDNDKKIKDLQITVDNLKDNILDLNYQINISESNPHIKTGKTSSYIIWNAEKMLEYYDSKRIKNKQEIERLEKSIEKHKKHIDTLEVRQKIRKIK